MMMDSKPDDAAVPAEAQQESTNVQPPAGFPLEVRSHGFELTDPLRSHAEQHVRTKMEKHAHRIQAVIVRMEDLNGGSRGGIDKICRIEILLGRMPRLIVEERHEDMYAAIDMASDTAKYVVQQNLERRRMKPRERARTLQVEPQRLVRRR